MTDRFAMIVQPVVSVLTAPSADAEMADEALHGCVCRVLSREGGRTRILSHYGYVGYVEDGALRFLSEEEAKTWLSSRLRVVDALFLDVLKKPGVCSARLTCLPAGALVEALCKPSEDGWQKVRLADGREGYAPAKHLMEKRFGDDHLLPSHTFSFPSLLDRFYEGSETAFRSALVSGAKKYIGIQYRWGGRSGFGVDCSGLVSLAYMRAGVNIFRDARIAGGFPIKRLAENEALRAGDLLFFPGHVAMFIGEGKYIHSTARAGSNGVVLSSLDPSDPAYRADLADTLFAAGGIR